MSGDEDLAELVVVVPTEFVAARNARAKALRAAGDKERAAAVAKLRKPSWTAWVLNVLARDEPDAIGSFLAAGLALADALGQPGGDRDAVRAAQQGERAAMAAVVERATARLAGAGRTMSDQDRQRASATLRAAVTDAEVRDQVVRGVLVDDIDASAFGFGFGFGLDPAPDAEVVNLDSVRSKRAARMAGATNRTKPAAAADGAAATEHATEQEAAEREAAEREAAERKAAERKAAEAAAAEAEAERAAAERAAAERARLDGELRARRVALEARSAEVLAAEVALADARDAEAEARRAVDEAIAAIEALPDP